MPRQSRPSVGANRQELEAFDRRENRRFLNNNFELIIQILCSFIMVLSFLGIYIIFLKYNTEAFKSLPLVIKIAIVLSPFPIIHKLFKINWYHSNSI